MYIRSLIFKRGSFHFRFTGRPFRLAVFLHPVEELVGRMKPRPALARIGQRLGEAQDDYFRALASEWGDVPAQPGIGSKAAHEGVEF